SSSAGAIRHDRPLAHGSGLPRVPEQICRRVRGARPPVRCPDQPRGITRRVQIRGAIGNVGRSPLGTPLLAVDHLVWGGHHLPEEIDRLEDLTGVRPSIGGRHPGEGTHNALLRLGPAMYLELIAPDPFQEQIRSTRWFGLDTLTSPRLVAWAVKSTDLIRRAARARSEGVPLGGVRSGRREDSGGHGPSLPLTYTPSRAAGA